MRVIENTALVALGSALGGLSRWAVARGTHWWWGSPSYVGTFIINVTGSLFLGWFATIVIRKGDVAQSFGLEVESLKLFFAVGFTGAFTTFSTFEFEGNLLLQSGQTAMGTTYLLGSVIVGLLALRFGVWLAGGA